MVTLRNVRRSVLRGLQVGVLAAFFPLLAGGHEVALCVFIVAQAVVPASWVEFWGLTWADFTRERLKVAGLVFLASGLSLCLFLLQGLYAMGALQGGLAGNPTELLELVFAQRGLGLLLFLLQPLAWLMAIASYGQLCGSFTEDGARIDAWALCIASALATVLVPFLIFVPFAALSGSLGDILTVAGSLGVVGFVLLMPIYFGSGLLFHLYTWADGIDARIWPLESD